MSRLKKLIAWGASILFWSVISAAFIGPGTVTTAAKAGATYTYQLIWALLFSVFACWILQETAARLPIYSRLNLGETIAKRYVSQPWIKRGVVLAIIIGGIAYQAGNILGGVTGLALITDVNPVVLTLLIGLLASGVLLLGNEKRVAQLLGIIVAVMGIAFVWVAISIPHKPIEMLTGSFIPQIPPHSEIFILGLIGTTIVPYNIFLGSGIRHTYELNTMRWGLGIAIWIGGLISLAILLAGTQVESTFSFDALAVVMENQLGAWSRSFFALGLFAAGFTSAVTAPLAAAITARSIWGYLDPSWHTNSYKFRAVWMMVMLSGIAFGVSGIRPIPAIILAQALNGLLLPFVAILLYISIKRITKEHGISLPGYLMPCMMIVLVVATLLGLLSLTKTGATLIDVSIPDSPWFILLLVGMSLSVGLVVYLKESRL